MGSVVAMVVRLRQYLVGAEEDVLGSLVPFGARSSVNRVQDTLIQSQFGSSGISHISALRGSASADNIDVARHFCGVVSYFLRVGFGTAVHNEIQKAGGTGYTQQSIGRDLTGGGGGGNEEGGGKGKRERGNNSPWKREAPTREGEKKNEDKERRPGEEAAPPPKQTAAARVSLEKD
ncbi:hypothetical protein RHMOL_Rhmol05G0278000 [Rhododendron molle]|uniref:Uncharacterized protein n=1 Tax=Rhododendron molle TaxID=49168 RepID=A0ACC0NUU9_RHOML|nr:hypothetical protein RHMOL_Rhmol05G0278000 [Rhododendron molle]